MRDRRIPEDRVLLLLLAAMLGLMTFSVVNRFVLTGSTFASLDQVLPDLLVWLSLLGAATAARRGGHLGMTALVDRLPPGGRRALLVLEVLAAELFLAVLVWQGTVALARQVDLATRASSGYPAWIVTAALPVGGALAMLRSAQAGRDRWRELGSAGPAEVAVADVAAVDGGGL